MQTGKRLGDRLADQAGPLLALDDGERCVDVRLGRIHPEDPRAERMDGPDDRRGELVSGGPRAGAVVRSPADRGPHALALEDDVVDLLPELAGGLFGEGDRDDLGEFGVRSRRKISTNRLARTDVFPAPALAVTERWDERSRVRSWEGVRTSVMRPAGSFDQERGAPGDSSSPRRRPNKNRPRRGGSRRPTGTRRCRDGGTRDPFS